MKLLPSLLISYFISSAYGFNLQSRSPGWQAIREKTTTYFLNHVSVLSLLSSLVLLEVKPQPVFAVSDEISSALETVIIEASDATYPLLQTLSSDSISPLANKIADILTKKIPPEKLAKALDGTADLFVSIPDEKLDSFVNTVKNSYTDISTDSCNTVPFPRDAIVMISSSEAVSKVTVDKKEKVIGKIGPLIQVLPSVTTKGICLPSVEGLERVWVGQTQLVLSIPTPMKRQFISDIGPALKSVSSSDVIRLVPLAKKTLAGVNPREVSSFQRTGKALDKALKQDYRFKSL